MPANIVDYGSIIEVAIEKGERKQIRTVLFSDSEDASDYTKVLPDSPLGKLIYQREEGFTGSYNVGTQVLRAEILKIE